MKIQITNKRRFNMVRKSLSIIILFLCFGIILMGCPKKTVVREEPSVKRAEELAAEREKAARLEAERAAKEKEAREKELARIREEEAKRAREKELEKSLVAKKEPGIEGEILESKLLKDIHFDFDKYDIRPGDTEVLKSNAALLMKHPTIKIQIEGHCDERGTIEYNLALGERRANSAKKYLISLGLSGNRISTISYGKERPLDPGHNEGAWAKNRRGHFIILSK
jgi:peptidoglycan-associated lipoprotein